MNELVSNFISQQLKTNEYNFIVEVYNFLYNYININNVEIHKNMIIGDHMQIPFSFVNTCDSYPIEEYSMYGAVPLRIGEITYKNIKVLLIFGIDWLGIRYCGDNGYYLMMQYID